MSTLEEILQEHGGTRLRHFYDPSEYDPQAAHDYYERHKKLKGRQPGAQKSSGGRRHSRASGLINKHGHAKVKAKSPEQRRKEIEARVASLKAKLARLSQILQKLVKEAKQRSGVDTSTDTSTKDTSTTKDTGPSKLTPQERKKAAERSKEYRDKHKDTPEEQAAQLEQKIAEVTQKIKDLRAQLAEARAKTQPRTSSSVGARAKPNK